MNLLQTRIDALEALGYTEDEAHFLYLVATHSGYFVARQFLGFTGARWGKRTTLFWNKLQAGQHARTYRFAKGGTAYHLFSRKVYRQIGRENLRNRREHELEYIRARIAMLDFVLGNLDLNYLETEPDKVAFLLWNCSCPNTICLPRATAEDTRRRRRFVTSSTALRCSFRPLLPSSRIVTFTYIQGAEVNLVGFVHHLQMYLLSVSGALRVPPVSVPGKGECAFR